MIHYNPELHRETIVSSLKFRLKHKVCLTHSIYPAIQNGEHPDSSYFIVDGHTYIIENKDLRQLGMEAWDSMKEEYKLYAAKELGVPVESVEGIVNYTFFAELLNLGNTSNVLPDEDFHPHLLNASALEQRFGMDGFISKPVYYNMECRLSDAPTDMPVEKYTMKIDYTK